MVAKGTCFVDQRLFNWRWLFSWRLLAETKIVEAVEASVLDNVEPKFVVKAVNAQFPAV